MLDETHPAARFCSLCDGRDPRDRHLAPYPVLKQDKFNWLCASHATQKLNRIEELENQVADLKDELKQKEKKSESTPVTSNLEQGPG